MRGGETGAEPALLLELRKCGELPGWYRPFDSRLELVAKVDNSGWSVYGAQRSQPVATGGKCTSPEIGSNKPKPLPPGCDSCRSERMVNRRSISIPGEKVTSTLAKEEVDLSVEAPNPRKPEGSQGLDADDHDNHARVGQAPARPPARR